MGKKKVTLWPKKRLLSVSMYFLRSPSPRDHFKAPGKLCAWLVEGGVVPCCCALVSTTPRNSKHPGRLRYFRLRCDGCALQFSGKCCKTTIVPRWLSLSTSGKKQVFSLHSNPISLPRPTISGHISRYFQIGSLFRAFSRSLK